MKRKLLVLLLAALTLFACAALFAACGGTSGGTDGGGNDEPPQHTHTFADDWTYNETHHWHAATCEHTDETSGMAPHEWNEGTVTLQPGCTEEGERTYTCECGATKTGPVDALGHLNIYNRKYDETYHWYECGRDGCDAVLEKAEQAWDNGTITKNATCTEEGERKYACSNCPARKTEPIEPIGHAFSENLAHNDTHHWYPCTHEGCSEGIEQRAPIPTL